MKISRQKFFDAIAWIEQADIRPAGIGQLVGKKK